MKPVSLNDYLNVDNPWSKRLLGIVEFQKVRDIQQIENEYNLDKYGKLLEFNFKTIEEYKNKEFEQAHRKEDLTISLGDDIFNTSIENARAIYYKLIKDTINRYNSENICELGCGYGFNLNFIGKNAYGGEYSENAVKIAEKLGLDVRRFNYYNPEDYNFIKPDSTVFTAHSIEQIPDASVVIDNLTVQKSKINYVIHFEPTIVRRRTSLLGLLRNKYMEMNDYNHNLIEILTGREDIEILELKTDIMGLVPLNSSNLIVWKFKK